jgi:hypothetical protein
MINYSAFTSINNVVKNKNVDLLGSAPGTYLAESFKNPLICINGASLGIKGEITPEITIINTSVAGSKKAGIPTRELIKNIHTKLLIIIESGFPLEKSQEIFNPIKRESTAIITFDERTIFLENFLKISLTGKTGEHVPSTGFFSLLLLLYCGAARINVKGLSFEDGHSYLQQIYLREHKQMDLHVLNWIAESNYPIEFSPKINYFK